MQAIQAITPSHTRGSQTSRCNSSMDTKSHQHPGQWWSRQLSQSWIQQTKYRHHHPAREHHYSINDQSNYLETLASWIQPSRNGGVLQNSTTQSWHESEIYKCSKSQRNTYNETIRLGKCGTNKYLHELNITNTSCCESCGKVETIAHLLLQCKANGIAPEIRKSCKEHNVLPTLLNALQSENITSEICRLVLKNKRNI